MSWKTPDIRRLVEQLRKLREATMSGNAGAFAVPLGAGVLRRGGTQKPKIKKK